MKTNEKSPARQPRHDARRREFLRLGAQGAGLLALGNLAAGLHGAPDQPTPPSVSGAYPGNDPGPFEVIEERPVAVKMRAGITVFATVYRPARAGQPVAGRLPAVLVRSPYDRSKYGTRARYFAAHGYLSVTQDVRGRFESEGKFGPGFSEVEDGADTIAWLAHFPRYSDIPMLWVTGWYDGYPRCFCNAYGLMKKLGRGANQHLLLGPWIHGQLGGNVCGDADFGPHAHIPEMDTQRIFFDRHLKRVDAAPRTSRVRAFVMGGGSGRKTAEGHLHAGGTWWHGDDWPPPGMRITPYHLHADRTLRAVLPGRAEGQTRWRSDPNDPVPSIASPWMFIGHTPRGPADQREPTALIGNCIPGRPLAARADVCVFQTPPLREPLRVLGPLIVRLLVSSDAPDTDFVAKLVDVYPANTDYPEGYGMTVCDGTQRMLYRESNVNLKPMESGRVYEIAIECFPAANLFAAGHLEYFQSADGHGIDLHVATRAPLTAEWHTVVVTVDPMPAGGDVVKVYFDGWRQDLSRLVDTGRHGTHRATGSRLTLGCHFDESGRPVDYFRGFVNQFAVTADVVTAEEAIAIHAGGTPVAAHAVLDHLVSAPHFDAAIDSADGYVIPDHRPGNRYRQRMDQAAPRRRSHWVRWLNPHGLEMPMKVDDFTTDENWWTFSNQAGASFLFNAPGLRFRTEQTGTFDPDRDTCIVVSKGSYGLAKGELWVRVDDYTWDTNPELPLTHGGFVIHDIRNDKTYLFWTHRTMRADHLGNYRLLYGVNGRQRDFETSVAKGKDVFVRIEGTRVSWFYNNDGVLTQVWSDQSVDLGRHVQIRFHARDFNIYHGPRNYEFRRIRIYRSRPDDL
ncbi:MAG: CocE/NonD family hydrolase [Verrucomicrobia bacterium]|nr:CocE/NonD family hydrolase [Verrucomicrobiota bacterium]